jgi:hypothetical protein
MTDRISELRNLVPAQQTFGSREERSMRWLELGMALTALGAAVLLAFAH